MMVLIGSQKGGAGKSTLAMLLANYLAGNRSQRVALLDLDPQHAIDMIAKKAKVLENEPPYQVWPVDIENFDFVLKRIHQLPVEMIIVDMPAEMINERLRAIIQQAQVIICPFNYDLLTLQPTIQYALLVGKINTNIKQLFIPNRIKSNVTYDTRTDIENILKRLGIVVPALADRIAFQRINTQHTPSTLIPVVNPVLDLIYECYLRK
ncbi:ParA family protein [Mucilaginibacter gynuensis]